MYKNKNTHFYSRKQLEQDIENILFPPKHPKANQPQNLHWGYIYLVHNKFLSYSVGICKHF